MLPLLANPDDFRRVRMYNQPVDRQIGQLGALIKALFRHWRAKGSASTHAQGGAWRRCERARPPPGGESKQAPLAGFFQHKMSKPMSKRRSSTCLMKKFEENKRENYLFDEEV